MAALVLTTYEKHKRVTEIIAETVARRRVADAAAERDTVELVANKVSVGSEKKIRLRRE